MSWVQSEYVFKGAFLGLLLFAALQAGDARDCLIVLACLLSGLVIGLTIAAYEKGKAGFRMAGKPLAYFVFLLLESPKLVYAGIVFGLFAGALAIRQDDSSGSLFTALVAGGAAIGLAFGQLRHWAPGPGRFAVALAAGVALVASAIFAVEWYGLVPDGQRRMLGIFLLMGLPFFYLLAFAGEAEESEIEVAAWSATLALAIWLIRLTPNLPLLGLVLPAAIYYGYSRFVLPGLRVFKHALRGMSYSRLGRYRPALVSLRRAVELDPANRLAKDLLWDVHRNLDSAKIAADPDLIGLVEPGLCLDRAASLLAEVPSAEACSEAAHLLDLVETQAPDREPQILYWRAVAATHARDFDAAQAKLGRLLNPTEWPRDSASRRAILFPAWHLALTLHPELAKRVGNIEVTKPGRRLDAIASVEDALAESPDDATAWGLKRLLYSELTPDEYQKGSVARFDYPYVEQLGLALVGDPKRFERGIEYLRIAGSGMPERSASIAQRIAQAYEARGDAESARAAYEAGKQACLKAGIKNLPDDEKAALFVVVKRLADDALARGDRRAAIANLVLFTQSERSGIETYRALAGLYEQEGDALQALRSTAQGLLYNSKDADLLDRRDRYYYSVTPEQLRSAPEAVQQIFDVAYCTSKSRQILEGRELDLEMLDWAEHLAELALILKPENLAAKVCKARSQLRRGHRDDAVATLETVREIKQESIATSDDQDAYFLACRLLGDLYLKELDQPAKALDCFTEFRKSSKSGADTLYKLGQASEQLGDLKRAAKFYEQVIAYDSHPLAPDARSALARVKES